MQRVFGSGIFPNEGRYFRESLQVQVHSENSLFGRQILNEQNAELYILVR